MALAQSSGFHMTALWFLPLWLILLLLMAGLVLGHEVGFRVGRIAARSSKSPAGEGDVGRYVTAALGLLALLIGFTFAMAIDRYNKRRDLVAQEAIAITAEYWRIQALPEPFRNELGRSLAQYAAARRDYSLAQTPRQLEAAWIRTERLQSQMLSETARTAEASRSPLAAPLLEETVSMLKLAASRRAALSARVPLPVLRLLVLYALATAVFMGYGASSGRRHFAASTFQFFLISLAITLVLDLERPGSNIGSAAQAPLLEAVSQIPGVQPTRH
jgi:hypothetical protein